MCVFCVCRPVGRTRAPHASIGVRDSCTCVYVRQTGERSRLRLLGRVCVCSFMEALACDRIFVKTHIYRKFVFRCAITHLHVERFFYCALPCAGAIFVSTPVQARTSALIRTQHTWPRICLTNWTRTALWLPQKHGEYIT